MAETTKLITELKRLTGRAFVELVNQGDVIVKYTGDKVARLSKYSEATPQPPSQQPAPPSTGAIDLRNWTVMLPTGVQGDPDNWHGHRARARRQVLPAEGVGRSTKPVT